MNLQLNSLGIDRISLTLLTMVEQIISSHNPERRTYEEIHELYWLVFHYINLTQEIDKYKKYIPAGHFVLD